MRKLPIAQLKPGMILARTLYNERGDVLLRRGAALTSRYVEALRTRGFFAVYVWDGIADDVEPEDAIFERVRAAAQQHVYNLFALASRASAASAVGDQRDVLAYVTRAATPHIERLAQDVERIVEEVLGVETLPGVTSLKTHDNYSFEHSVEVTVAGVLLGRRLRLSLDELHQLALGCFLHDIGKLWVPQEVLGKPSRLSPEEYALVQKHPQAGYEMAKQVMPDYAIIARQVIWQHHERQDGTGYPRQLRGGNDAGRQSLDRFERGHILGVAEIAAVADVYSALASDRPHRPAVEPPQIVGYLQQMAGSHLNREVVRSFLSVLPIYPVGAQVVVLEGKLRGYRGAVTAINPRAVDRPIVRILFNPQGRSIAPFEVDTGKASDVILAPLPAAEQASATV